MLEEQKKFYITDSADRVRIDLFLSRQTGQSRNFIKTLIESGKVSCNQALCQKPSYVLKSKDQVEIEWVEYPLASSLCAIEPVAKPLEILFEDTDLLVINKPQGVVVHPAPGHRKETLVNYLLYHLQSHLKEDDSILRVSSMRPGIVHRLDRGTSGVILVAKNRQTLESLALQFRNRSIQKEYEALVWGKTQKKGTFQNAIGRDPFSRLKMSSRSTVAKIARTDWMRVENFSEFSLLRLFPLTGRTHQIRVHLSEAGFPIVGDHLYLIKNREQKMKTLSDKAKDRILSASWTYLHASAITFTHPKKNTVLRIEAPKPVSFTETIEFLKNEQIFSTT